MNETKVTYQLSGDGFYREHNTLEETQHWFEYFKNQGKKNIRLTKTTTTRELLQSYDEERPGQA